MESLPNHLMPLLQWFQAVDTDRSGQIDVRIFLQAGSSSCLATPVMHLCSSWNIWSLVLWEPCYQHSSACGKMQKMMCCSHGR